MNNLEKLTEATILALQGKLNENKKVCEGVYKDLLEDKTSDILTEKENPENRAINAKIRQADKYIDDLLGLGLGVSLIFDMEISDYDEMSNKLAGYDMEYIDINGDYRIPITSQKQYNDLMNIVNESPDLMKTYLVVTTSPDVSEPANNVYNVDKGYIYDYRYDYDYDFGSDINKDTDIYNFLISAKDVEFDEDGMPISHKYAANAKYSEDALDKNSARLRDDVETDLKNYKTAKDQQQQLSDKMNTLQKTNTKSDNGFENDMDIINTQDELDTVNDKLKDLSREDGTFNMEKSREYSKNIRGNKTV